MKVIKSENKEIQAACLSLMESRKLKSRAEKLEKLSKTSINAELKEHGIDTGSLPIGETIILKLRGKDGFDDCLRVTVKPNSRVDLQELTLKYPNVEKDVRKDFPCVYYDPLNAETTDQTELETVTDELKKRKIELEKTINSMKALRKAGVGITQNK